MSIRNRLEEHKEEIFTRIDSGESTNSIAKDFNCNPGTIWFFLRDNNKSPKKSRSKVYGKGAKYKDIIIKMLKDGYSYYAIAKEVPMSEYTVAKYAQKWGYTTSHKSKRDDTRPYLKNRFEEVLALHEQGYSQNEIGRELGYSGSQVCILLQKHGIKAHAQTVYSIDTSYFKTINTQEKAYVLGWFYSDGNVMADGRMRIALQSEDAQILEWIKTEMKYSGPLYKKPARGNSKEQTELCINRKEVCNDLIALGCVPSKSLILHCPTYQQVPEHLFRHFIRGYFDGDGSVNKSCVMIIGSHVFTHELAHLLPCNVTNIYQRYKDRPPQASAHQLCISKKDEILKFLNWIYTDATICLERKFKKAQQLFGIERSGV